VLGRRWSVVDGSNSSRLENRAVIGAQADFEWLSLLAISPVDLRVVNRLDLDDDLGNDFELAFRDCLYGLDGSANGVMRVGAGVGLNYKKE
jgi:hypothetical protein